MPDPVSEAYDSFCAFDQDPGSSTLSDIDVAHLQPALATFLGAFRVADPAEVAKSLVATPALTKEEYGFVIEGKVSFTRYLQFLVQHSHLLPEAYRDVFDESIRDIGIVDSGEGAVVMDEGAGCRALLYAADEMFNAADTNGDGCIDGSELTSLVEALCKHMGVENKRVEVETAAVAQMEADGGLIDFNGFLRMLCQPPWSHLLGNVGDMKRLAGLLDDTKPSGPVEVIAGDRSEADGRALLYAAEDVFVAVDKNDDGWIDGSELQALITALCAKMGVREGELDEAKFRALGHRATAGAKIDFYEFLQLLCDPPWSFLLSETDSLVEVLNSNNVIMSENFVLHLASDCFDEADTNGDGVVDRSELQTLMTKLWKGTGRSEQDVEAVMERFDTDHNGSLSFDEFCWMLCAEPWSQLMPEGERVALRAMLAGSEQRARSPRSPASSPKPRPPVTKPAVAQQPAAAAPAAAAPAAAAPAAAAPAAAAPAAAAPAAAAPAAAAPAAVAPSSPLSPTSMSPRSKARWQLRMQEDCLNMLQDEVFSDVTFVVEGCSLHFGKKMLCSRQPHLKSLFLPGGKWADQRTIAVEGTTAEAFRALLMFCYCGHCPELSQPHQDALVELAKELKLEGLLKHLDEDLYV